jgi:hypothetical protein
MIEAQVALDESRPRPLLEPLLVTAGAVLHRWGVTRARFGGMTAATRRVIGGRELAVTDVAVGADDMKADVALHAAEVHVHGVREPRRLGLPDVFDRIWP